MLKLHSDCKLPSIPWCLSLPFFLVFCGRTEGPLRLLRLATLSTVEEHQGAISNFPLMLGLRSVCSLNLSWRIRKPVNIFFSSKSLKKQNKPLESLPQFSPITVNHFLKRTLKCGETVAMHRLKSNKSQSCENWNTEWWRKKQFNLNITKLGGIEPYRNQYPVLSASR